MKRLSQRTFDDQAALPELVGAVGEGRQITQNGLLKNTGDETIHSLKMWVENAAALDLTMTANVGGVDIPEAASAPGTIPAGAVEVLTAPLLVGESLAVLRTWTAPSTISVQGMDSADLCYYAS